MSVGLIYVVSVFDHYLKVHLNSNQLIKSSVKDVYPEKKNPRLLTIFSGMSIAGNRLLLSLDTEELKMN